VILGDLEALLDPQAEPRVAAGAELGDLVLQLGDELALLLASLRGLLVGELQRLEVRLQGGDVPGEGSDALVHFFAVVPAEGRGELLS
jgi:hypothetical protein